MDTAKLFRWAAAVLFAFGVGFAVSPWPGLDVHRERFHVVVDYPATGRLVAVLALLISSGLALLASISLELSRIRTNANTESRS
jgi:hypothetical protein